MSDDSRKTTGRWRRGENGCHGLGKKNDTAKERTNAGTPSTECGKTGVIGGLKRQGPPAKKM